MELENSKPSLEVGTRLTAVMWWALSNDKEIKEQQDFAEAIGCGKGRLTLIKEGNVPPTLDNVVKVLTRFPVSANWLLTGKGTMISKGESDPIAIVTDLVNRNQELEDQVRAITVKDNRPPIRTNKTVRKNGKIALKSAAKKVAASRR